MRIEIFILYTILKSRLYIIYTIIIAENFRVSVQNENFAEKTFVDCSDPIIIIMELWPQNFAEKTFTDGSETAKTPKVFSLECFPLYVYTCSTVLPL